MNLYTVNHWAPGVGHDAPTEIEAANRREALAAFVARYPQFAAFEETGSSGHRRRHPETGAQITARKARKVRS